MSRRRSVGAAVGLVALVLVAVVAGAVSGFVHRTTVDILGWDAPVGIVAGLGALVGLVLVARWYARSGVLLVGAAYLLPVLLLSQFRSEGDLVVAEDAWGLSLLGGAALIITVGVTVPIAPYHGSTSQPRPAPRPPSPTPAEQP